MNWKKYAWFTLLLLFPFWGYAQGIIAGQITDEFGTPIKGVVVALNGLEPNIAITDASGYYQFMVPFGGAYEVHPHAHNNTLNGVSIFDQVLIEKHITLVDPLDSPYKIIAADINLSNSVDTSDLSSFPLLFSASYAWRFIDADYIFPNPSDPFSAAFPEVFMIDNFTSDILDINFIGVRIGDVNNSADLNLEPDTTLLSKITGNIFQDQNENCEKNTLEEGLQQWSVLAKGDANFYGTSNENGDYVIYVTPGMYDVEVITPNALWEACQANSMVNLDFLEEVEVNFPIHITGFCPYLTVDISTPRLRRCFNNVYVVHYCNLGTETALDAFIEVEFDPFLTVEGSTLPWSNSLGNFYTFEVGDVEIGACGSFQIEVNVSCDAVLGQTHCTEAHIYPDSLCTPTNPLWDGSSLEVEGTCINDSVSFEIINVGENMEAPVNFIVIEDDMVQMTSDPILLNAGDKMPLSFEALGSTWRLELDQVEYHPGQSMPSTTIEGCGTNGNGAFSLGYFTQYPQDDADHFVDIDCQENVGAYDPNDKRAFPKGFCNAHYIRPNTDIEYQIRFQNTGTDTAFNITIRDTLSPLLDPATARAGAASHAYQFELIGEGVVQFTFENILLPDSVVNVEASQGFVEFKIAQVPDLPIDAVIKNKAAIYFDFNEPIITNEFYHTIGDNYVEPPSGNLSISGNIYKPNGTPVDSVLVFVTDDCPIYTNEDGYYLIENLEAGNDYTIAPTKLDDIGQCVTVLDMVKMRQHILLQNVFSSPYQYIAGDISAQSGGITTFDLVLMRKMILQNTAGFQYPGWTFVSADFVLPPAPPFGGFPQTVSINNFQNNLDSIDFIAVNMGDVISENMVATSSLQPEFIIESSTACGETVALQILVNNFTSINGFQMPLQWDASILELEDIIGNGLALDESSFFSPTAGLVNIAWLNPATDGATLEDGSLLLTIHFNVIGNIGSSSPISLALQGIPFQVITNGCDLAQPIFQDGTIDIFDGASILLANEGMTTTHNLCPTGDDGAIDLMIEGGTPPFTFAWSTGATTEDLENLTLGNYTCTVTDAIGCALILNFEVQAPPLLDIINPTIVDASSNLSSDGAIFIDEVVGATPPYTFLWLESGVTTSFLANIPAGTYALQITDNNGCLFLETFEVGSLTKTNDLENLGIQIALQPNPSFSGNQAFMRLKLAETMELKIQISDVAGRKWLEQTERFAKGETFLEMKNTKLKGVYFIQVSTMAGQRSLFKWVVHSVTVD